MKIKWKSISRPSETCNRAKLNFSPIKTSPYAFLYDLARPIRTCQKNIQHTLPSSIILLFLVSVRVSVFDRLRLSRPWRLSPPCHRASSGLPLLALPAPPRPPYTGRTQPRYASPNTACALSPTSAIFIPSNSCLRRRLRLSCQKGVSRLAAKSAAPLAAGQAQTAALHIRPLTQIVVGLLLRQRLTVVVAALSALVRPTVVLDAAAQDRRLLPRLARPAWPVKRRRRIVVARPAPRLSAKLGAT